MKKLLFLPFLSIPSGHQHVADALIQSIRLDYPNIECKKIDIFSYSYGKIEEWITQFYLKWVHYSPQTYNELYKFMVLKNKDNRIKHLLYEIFFKKQIEELIRKINPDCIICTHALPSRLVNDLKQKGRLNIPAFNIYTDFFIHKGWGIQHMNGHFIATLNMKQYLLNQGINHEKIFFTGIPVHPFIKRKSIEYKPPQNITKVLISGGSMGAGQIEKLIQYIEENPLIHYFILCGKNNSLYKKLKLAKQSNITPLCYIRSRKMMDILYDESQIIITKPGGVTISECLLKRKPIYIYDKLPGQEEMNFRELKEMKLIKETNKWDYYGGLNEEILNFVNSPSEIEDYFQYIYKYDQNRIIDNPIDIIMERLNKF